ncbi:NAD(P)H oxidoreductase [Oleibacter sp. HI0075]|nr:NAD(P)H oxidoreductase [Oleibacter sp. HI0075]
MIVYAHPAHQRSRANRALLNRISDLHNVTVHDLYETYPDFFIDVEAEQKLLLEHDLIVIQHPVYWYNMPALLREWQDLVLEYGYAYGRKQQRLAGKYMWVVLTAGAPEHTYSDTGVNERPLSEYFLHYPRMANVCHLEMKPTFEVYHGRHSPDEDLDKTVEQYRSCLLKYLKEHPGDA